VRELEQEGFFTSRDQARPVHGDRPE